MAAMSLLLLLWAVSLFALATKRDIPCTCFGFSGRRLGKDTLLIASTLVSAEAAYLAVRMLGDWTAPHGSTFIAVVALALSLILLYRWLGVASTAMLIVGQRRRLRGAGQ